ncbi:MAG TPA: 4-hydroxyphenylpyruvate dioxygenase [Actinocrinis sp.]|nr:4-hydroxyphenylpyruvate dioxygenase [Actinocrinis sp.]
MNNRDTTNIRGIAYAEFHVEDLAKAAANLVEGFGFSIEPPGGQGEYAPSDGAVQRIGLRSGGVRLILAAAADPEHPVAEFARRHGDGVAVVAVSCQDPEAAYAYAVEQGATPVDAHDLTIAGFGDSAIRFAPLSAVGELATPLRAAVPAPRTGSGPEPSALPPPVHVTAIDHVAVCVPSGALAGIIEFCDRMLGLRRIFGGYIKVGSQGMDSVVMQSESGAVTFTVLEPDAAAEPGQIDDFLDGHGGAGIQHLALRTTDIADGIRRLGERGVDFLSTPAAYYDALEQRLGRTEIPLGTLRELNILVDQDHGGRLFQIFTRSVHTRRTYFFELIERRGASTFGTANVTALYEAIDRETPSTRPPTATTPAEGAHDDTAYSVR